ncbi:MAG: hydroxymethylbilane synthase [Planctomycetota bacterium]
MSDASSVAADQPLRLGTRASKLARWQSDWVAAALRQRGHAVEIVEIQTSGDAQQTGPIGAIGQTGVFTKEIQRALRDGRVELAVHSLKDLPTTPVEGLALAAVPQREGVRDAMVSHAATSLSELPRGAHVGTGSFRRRSQLLNLRPDLWISDLRGNVDTRLRKLDAGQYDAILLAEAGLRRLGLAGRITQAIPAETLLPAPGQGALGIECRAGDQPTLAALAPLNHAATRAAVEAERAALAHLEGGCLAALGAWARSVGGEEGSRLQLSVVVLSEDGRHKLFEEHAGAADSPVELGRAVAQRLLDRGAAQLLRDR